jgi:hypothetical protein
MKLAWNISQVLRKMNLQQETDQLRGMLNVCGGSLGGKRKGVNAVQRHVAWVAQVDEEIPKHKFKSRAFQVVASANRIDPDHLRRVYREVTKFQKSTGA